LTYHTDHSCSGLFSDREYSPPIVSDSSLDLSDAQLKGNPEQLAAIVDVVNKSPNEPCATFPTDQFSLHRNNPYLIFGPFGTGKTKCLVEAIRQVLNYRPESKILICAPANRYLSLLESLTFSHVSAVDALLEQLENLPFPILRLYPQRRAYHTVPTRLQKFASYDHNKEQFNIPSQKELLKFSIVFTTWYAN